MISPVAAAIPRLAAAANPFDDDDWMTCTCANVPATRAISPSADPSSTTMTWVPNGRDWQTLVRQRRRRSGRVREGMTTDRRFVSRCRCTAAALLHVSLQDFRVIAGVVASAAISLHVSLHS